jgi:hypothetical protein
VECITTKAGLRKSSIPVVDPALETARFQPLNLCSENPVSKVCSFKFNSYLRYTKQLTTPGTRQPHSQFFDVSGGALHVESS